MMKKYIKKIVSIAFFALFAHGLHAMAHQLRLEFKYQPGTKERVNAYLSQLQKLASGLLLQSRIIDDLETNIALQIKVNHMSQQIRQSSVLLSSINPRDLKPRPFYAVAPAAAPLEQRLNYSRNLISICFRYTSVFERFHRSHSERNIVALQRLVSRFKSHSDPHVRGWADFQMLSAQNAHLVETDLNDIQKKLIKSVLQDFDKQFTVDPFCQEWLKYAYRFHKAFKQYSEKVLQEQAQGCFADVFDESDERHLKLKQEIVEQYRKKSDFFDSLYAVVMKEIDDIIRGQQKKAPFIRFKKDLFAGQALPEKLICLAKNEVVIYKPDAAGEDDLARVKKIEEQRKKRAQAKKGKKGKGKRREEAKAEKSHPVAQDLQDHGGGGAAAQEPYVQEDQPAYESADDLLQEIGFDEAAIEQDISVAAGDDIIEQTPEYIVINAQRHVAHFEPSGLHVCLYKVVSGQKNVIPDFKFAQRVQDWMVIPEGQTEPIALEVQGYNNPQDQKNYTPDPVRRRAVIIRHTVVLAGLPFLKRFGIRVDPPKGGDRRSTYYHMPGEIIHPDGTRETVVLAYAFNRANQLYHACAHKKSPHTFIQEKMELGKWQIDFPPLG